MIINKVTAGFVVQRFDTDTRKFIDQSFISEDGCVWENSDGDSLCRTDDGDAELIFGKGGVDEPTLNFEMVQPTA